METPLQDLANGLEAIVAVQVLVSGMVGAIPESGEPIPNSHVTAMAFALIGETFEMVQELGWKYWANEKEMTPEQVERVAAEFADMLAFLGTLTFYVMERTGLSAMDLAKAYAKKTDLNIRRFKGKIAGYENPVGM